MMQKTSICANYGCQKMRTNDISVTLVLCKTVATVE